MGAKFSRRKNEAEGAAAGSEPAVAPAEQSVAPAEKPSAEPEPEAPATESTAAESAPAEEPAAAEPSGLLETITQAVEQSASSLKEELPAALAAPVDKVVTAGIGAVDSMMAAMSMKENEAVVEPVAVTPEPVPEPKPVPEPVAKPEPLVALTEEVPAPAVDLLAPEVPPVAELLASEPVIPKPVVPKPIIPEPVIPEPVLIEPEAPEPVRDPLPPAAAPPLEDLLSSEPIPAPPAPESLLPEPAALAALEDAAVTEIEAAGTQVLEETDVAVATAGDLLACGEDVAKATPPAVEQLLADPQDCELNLHLSPTDDIAVTNDLI